MNSRQLGKNGPAVSAQGLGAWNERVLQRTQRKGVACNSGSRIGAGHQFWDTADVYGYGDNEVLVGKSLRGGGREFSCDEIWNGA